MTNETNAYISFSFCSIHYDVESNFLPHHKYFLINLQCVHCTTPYIYTSCWLTSTSLHFTHWVYINGSFNFSFLYLYYNFPKWLYFETVEPKGCSCIMQSNTNMADGECGLILWPLFIQRYVMLSKFMKPFPIYIPNCEWTSYLLPKT